MSKALTLSFEHTPHGLRVHFVDNHGIWHELETVPYQMPNADPAHEELAYINMLRAMKPDMGIDVRANRYH